MQGVEIRGRVHIGVPAGDIDEHAAGGAGGEEGSESVIAVQPLGERPERPIEQDGVSWLAGRVGVARSDERAVSPAPCGHQCGDNVAADERLVAQQDDGRAGIRAECRESAPKLAGKPALRCMIGDRRNPGRIREGGQRGVVGGVYDRRTGHNARRASADHDVEHVGHEGTPPERRQEFGTPEPDRAARGQHQGGGVAPVSRRVGWRVREHAGRTMIHA